jgi:hypothetical protein
MTTPEKAQKAVQSVLAEVPREHEAAYLVICEALRICLQAGMNRREAAGYLGISRWRIDSQGRYFRSLKATRNLLRGAFSPANPGDTANSDAVNAIIRRAWSK